LPEHSPEKPKQIRVFFEFGSLVLWNVSVVVDAEVGREERAGNP